MDWGKTLPELTIFIAAVVLAVLDLFFPKRIDRNRIFSWLGLFGVVLALVFCFLQVGEPVATILKGTYRFDSFSIAFKMIMLAGTGVVFLMATDFDKKHEIEYRGEFYYLLLAALLGGMMMASSADMITLFVSLELLSLSSYVLVGLKKRNLASNEAAFKYLVNGGIASAIVLFGMSYIYGFSGSTNLYEISTVLNLNNHSAILFTNRMVVVFAIILVFVGLTFKLATVPFHMWAPDVYEGAPTPVTAFLSVVSKTAGFAMLVRFFFIAVSRAPGVHVSPTTGPEYALVSIQPYIAALAALAMIFGNTAALRQTNMKRLFAYSGIAQAGYVLVPFVAFTKLTLGDMWFYLLAYLFMNLGAFTVISIVSEKDGNEDIRHFSGLFRRSPWLALAMSVFLISLAGIPITAGFIGKFNIFFEALLSAHYWLASVMIATTVVSYFYYFSIMVKMFLRPAKSEGKISFSPGTAAAIVFCVIGTLGLGIFPDAAISFLHGHMPLSQFFQSP